MTSGRLPLVCAALVVSGFVAIGLAWRGAASAGALALQVPHAVSGGVAGLGLIVFGMAIAYIHVARVAAAREAALVDALTTGLAHSAAGIVVAGPRRAATPARRRARSRRTRAARPNSA